MADNFFKTTLALAALLSCAACQSGQAVMYADFYEEVRDFVKDYYSMNP